MGEALKKQAGSGWHEPTSLLPLRWGGYRSRYVAATALIIGGTLIALPTSVYAGYLLLIGLGLHIAGWMILPGRGLRRVAIALPSAILSCGLLLGSSGAVLLVVPLTAWLYLRQRPAVAYLVLALPVISGILLGAIFVNYGSGVLVAGISLVVVVGSAWLAQGIAKSRQIPSRGAHSRDKLPTWHPPTPLSITPRRSRRAQAPPASSPPSPPLPRPRTPRRRA